MRVNDLKVGMLVTTKSSQALAFDNGKRFIDGEERWRGKASGEIVSAEKTPRSGVNYYRVRHDDGKILGYWHTDIASWKEACLSG
jgi:hypothetical protein